MSHSADGQQAPDAAPAVTRLLIYTIQWFAVVWVL
jgi:hypothetical protein